MYERGQSVFMFAVIPCLDYSSTVKMKAVCTSETPVDSYQTTRNRIPQDNA
jgi:hypothetical protein